jgi:hypothetical protein
VNPDSVRFAEAFATDPDTSVRTHEATPQWPPVLPVTEMV